ncbi:Gfo/Idh/MocA family protein [Calycomorphotria hydatis]|uniref:Putative oxidoreductase YhhX n=1 Tax=Calycomorphotria hydatis TaxID=2528027 RepID=A0A517TES9_9PLAN|nr:Gfo/Idh/MocA family oxidoreductase [Calycomorphotria hydatis]QDT66869.1 putative oxidoreductase YhhX [Calycomorphotria hydatis]
MQRRTFLSTSLAAATTPIWAHAFEKKPDRTVGVIGHTGRGNYGHGLGRVWTMIPGIHVVAVADADPEGLSKKRQELNVERGFADYREMLDTMRPEFVSVAPRHVDQHFDMVKAAIESGAKGVYVEKPFCRSPEEADQLLELSEQQGTKIAVAHRNRYHPVLPVIEDLLARGAVGRILEMRGRGVGDHRGGSQDLWVLGSHVMNLFNYFGGEPVSCSGILLKDRKPVIKSDIQDGAEGLGPLGGNAAHARYEMANGFSAFYDTIANEGTARKGFGITILGSAGVILLRIDQNPFAYLIPGNPFDPAVKSRDWIPISTSGVGKPEERPKEVAAVANHVAAVTDLIDAVDNSREPKCSGADAALTVEMICGVFESHRHGGQRIEFPLKVRENPLNLM